MKGNEKILQFLSHWRAVNVIDLGRRERIKCEDMTYYEVKESELMGFRRLKKRTLYNVSDPNLAIILYS